MPLALPKLPGADDFGPPAVDSVEQAMAIIAAAQPAPVQQQPQATYDAPPATAPQSSGKYGPPVERWRGLVTQEFQKQGVPTNLDGVDLIDKALHVIQGESGGNEKAVGDGGAAYGLFQSHYVGSGASTSAQIADAVKLIAKNPAKWTDWGEGALYQGKPFGALGRTPYGSGGSNQTAPIGTALGGATGQAINDTSSPWGNREDGSPKGNGFLGVLKRPNGDVSTELSIGVNIDGKEMDVPTLVPTLTSDEKRWLLTNDVSDPSMIPPSIIQKAADYARQRISGGQSPFAGTGDVLGGAVGDIVRQQPQADIGYQSPTPDIDQQAPGSLRQQALDTGAYDNRTFPIAERLQGQAGDIGAAIGGVIPDFNLPRNVYDKGLSYQNPDGSETQQSPSMKVSPKDIGRGIGESLVPDTEAQFAQYPVTLATNLQGGAALAGGAKALVEGGAGSLLRTGGGSIIKDVGGQAAKDVAVGAAEAPLSPWEQAMQDSLAAGKKNAVDAGAQKAAQYVADSRAAAAAEGTQYAEASTLSKRVAELTGQAPEDVRANAIHNTKVSLDALKIGIQRAGPEENLLDTGLHAGVDGKLGQSSLEKALAERRPTTSPTGMPLYAPDTLDDLNKVAALDREQKGLGGSSFFKPPEPDPKSIGKKFVDEALGIVGLPQTVMASGDVSGLGRQMLPGLFVDKDAYAKGLVAYFKATGSEEGALAARAAVEQSPWYNIAKESGFHEWESGPGVAPSERVAGRGGINDSFIGRLSTNKWQIAGHQVPNPILGTERGFAAGLNAEGMAMFEKVAQSQYDAALANPKGFDAAAFEKQLRATAKVANDLRGYGANIGGNFFGFINALFSPRYTASRFQIVGDIFTQPGSLFEPSARQMAAKGFVGLMAANTALLSFAGVTGAMAGGLWGTDVNPFSGDFGKVRVGNTRFDATAGFAPLLRLLVRDGAAATDYGTKQLAEATGQDIATNLAPDNYEWKKAMLQFFQNKESPVAQMLSQALSGVDSAGKKVTWGPERAADFMMLYLQDIKDAWKENQGLPTAERAAVAGVSGLISAVGGGASSYHTQEDYRNEAAAKITDPETGQPYKDYASINDYGARKQIDQSIRDAGHAYPLSDQQKAAQTATEGFKSDQEKIDAALNDGQLTQKYSDASRFITAEKLGSAKLQSAFYDQMGIEPGSDFAKRFSTLIKGYREVATANTDEYGQMNFDDLKKAQASYIAGLSSKDQQLFKSYLAYNESLKTDTQKRYDTYQQNREAAGYYAIDPKDPQAASKRAALDKAHPDIDVENWVFNGGVKGGDDPKLNSPQGVDAALALNLPNRKVQFAGLGRDLTDPGAKKLWDDNKAVITNYFDDNVMLGGGRGATQAALLAAHTKDAEYRKPLDQMDSKHRSQVLSNVRDKLLDDHPDIEAALLVMGQQKDGKANTKKAYDLAGQLVQKYKLGRIGPDYRITLAKDAK